MRHLAIVALIGCSSPSPIATDAASPTVDAPVIDPDAARQIARGLFVLDPPTAQDEAKGRCGDLPADCFTGHVQPTLIAATGAGSPDVVGAVFQVQWDQISPTSTTYDFTALDGWMQPWSDAGKSAAFVFSPLGFTVGSGYVPAWYKQTPTIASASQTAGIIEIHTTSDVEFLPGGLAGAAKLEVQIAGTSTLLDGIWAICDHTTAGCQDPAARAIFAVGAGANIAAVTAGTIGNPTYGAACDSGSIPIEWRVNFMTAWQGVMQHAESYYAVNDHVAYLRFGMGIGGQTNPIIGSEDPACEADMIANGFTTVAAPWKTTSANWPQVTTVWIDYLDQMSAYVKSLAGSKPILLTLTPIVPTGGDNVTPDTVAKNAVAAGLGIGNQGLQQVDIANYNAGRACLSADWCANFDAFAGQAPLELQTNSASDPTSTDAKNRTGRLDTVLAFALARHATILELYVEDWLCTFDASSPSFGACAAADYPAAFATTAAGLR